MIYLKNYCTDFMFHVVIMFVTYLFTKLSIEIFNLPLVFEIRLLFLKCMSTARYKFQQNE